MKKLKWLRNQKWYVYMSSHMMRICHKLLWPQAIYRKDCRLLANTVKTNIHEPRPSKANKRIYIDLLNVQLSVDLQALIVGLGLSEQKGLSVQVITERVYLHKKLIQAFGFKEVYIYIKGVSYLFVSFVDALKCMLQINRTMKVKENVEKITYKEVYIGDLIYDDILHHYRAKGQVTIDKIRVYREFLRIWLSFLIVNVCEKMFQKNPPEYFITKDGVYYRGIAMRCALYCGAKGLSVSYFGAMKWGLDENGVHAYHSKCRKSIEEYLNVQKVTIGENSSVNVLEKSIIENNEIRDFTIEDNGKKNVVIFAHCLNDTSHVSNPSFFPDFYSWVLETLEQTKQIEDVNWYLRPHPLSYMYSEGDLLKRTVANYPHVKYLNENYAKDNLYKWVDVIVTASGTAGLEFSIHGIPVVVASNPYYAGWGFTYDAHSKEEYFEILKNVNQYEKLDSSQVEKAKRIAEAFNNITSLPNVEFCQLLGNYYVLNTENETVERFNHSYILKVCNLINGNAIYNSPLYKRKYEELL